MRKILDYLHWKDIGLLELVFALYPVLAGYSYGSNISFAFILQIVFILWSYRKKVLRKIDYKPLKYFWVFYTIHGVVLMLLIMGGGGRFQTLFNNLVFDTLLFLTIYRVAMVIDFKKMRGALYVMGTVYAIGLVYHFLLLQTGQSISPIPIPFLPAPTETSRLFAELQRPCSFFWEPAAYITFMMLPIFVAMHEKKYILAGAFSITNFLSTSTNGMIFTLLLIAIYAITQKLSSTRKFTVIGGGIALAVFLLTSPLFTQGRDKAENTDIESQARLVNGPYFIQTMDKGDLIFGIPNESPYDYVMEGKANAGVLLMDDGSMYIPAFWTAFIKFGIIGIIIYILYFLYPIKKCREVMPYCLVLLLSSFVQSILLNSNFFIQTVFIVCMMSYFTEENQKHLCYD